MPWTRRSVLTTAKFQPGPTLALTLSVRSPGNGHGTADTAAFKYATGGYVADTNSGQYDVDCLQEGSDGCHKQPRVASGRILPLVVNVQHVHGSNAGKRDPLRPRVVLRQQCRDSQPSLLKKRTSFLANRRRLTQEYENQRILESEAVVRSNARYVDVCGF
jgi:hypothetical protein